MLEKMIKDKIMNHLTEEKVLSSKKHGFVNGRSTVTQLLNYPGRESGWCYIHWFFYQIDISDSFVKVNRVKSEKRKVLSGVLQGSVISPLLFVLYINGLPEAVQAILYLFADNPSENSDKSPWFHWNFWKSLGFHLLQNNINALEEWSKIWLLWFHRKKSHVLTLGKFENIKRSHS